MIGCHLPLAYGISKKIQFRRVVKRAIRGGRVIELESKRDLIDGGKEAGYIEIMAVALYPVCPSARTIKLGI